MADVLSRERLRGKGGFAGIRFLYGLIFGTGAGRVPDSAVRSGHGWSWDFGKLAEGRMAGMRQIDGYGVD